MELGIIEDTQMLDGQASFGSCRLEVDCAVVNMLCRAEGEHVASGRQW